MYIFSLHHLEEVTDASNPDVVNKYKIAGEICNDTLKHVIANCKTGAKIVDICQMGDDYILDRTGKIFKGKKTEKGVGFPTCISINNAVGHFSPLATDTRTFAKGDVAKMYLFYCCGFSKRKG